MREFSKSHAALALNLGALSLLSLLGGWGGGVPGSSANFAAVLGKSCACVNLPEALGESDIRGGATANQFTLIVLLMHRYSLLFAT